MPDAVHKHAPKPAECDICHAKRRHAQFCPIGHVDINDRRAMARAEWNYQAAEDATW